MLPHSTQETQLPHTLVFHVTTTTTTTTTTTAAAAAAALVFIWLLRCKYTRATSFTFVYLIRYQQENLEK
jgi:hypothetical protein